MPAHEHLKNPYMMRVGKCLLYDEIALGGMASIHLGRYLGAAGFVRTVAVKRMHRQYAASSDFVAMFVDEARLTARIRHPNVVSVWDVIAKDDELFIVMDYVHGESLARLQRALRRRGEGMAPSLVSAVFVQVLSGLHAAHEARAESGQPLSIVHRDVSPQNILVGADGTARVLDFGIAKAASRLHTTQDGQVRGKLAYMAPEQLLDHPVDRRTDLFSVSVVLWEALVGEMLFATKDPRAALARILAGDVQPPSSRNPHLPKAIDAVLTRGLASDPNDRFASAREMIEALTSAVPPASSLQLADWVEDIAADELRARAALLQRIEQSSTAEMESTPTAASLLADDPPTTAKLLQPLQEPRTEDYWSTAVSRKKRRGRRVVWALVFIASAVVPMIVVALAVSPKQRGDAEITPSSAPPLAAEPDATGEATTRPNPPDPAPNMPPSTDASTARSDASAPAAPSPPNEATPTKPRATAPQPSGPAPRKPKPTPQPKAPKGNACDPPFYFDERGVKRYRAECFNR